jgi:hypothetical protein
MNIGDDYEVVQDETAPKGRRIVKKGQAVQAKTQEQAEDEVTVTGTYSGDQFSDEQLRAMIKAKTGKAPGGRTGRAKLIEQYKALP